MLYGSAAGAAAAKSSCGAGFAERIQLLALVEPRADVPPTTWRGCEIRAQAFHFWSALQVGFPRPFLGHFHYYLAERKSRR